MKLAKKRMTKDSFKVQQEKYQGPLETVIFLLRKRKLHVSDVNLVQIVDDFSTYLDSREEDMAELSDFVRVMSVLLLIKTKALLPKEVLGTDDEETIARFEADLQRVEVLSQVVESISIDNDFLLSAIEKPTSVPSGFVPATNVNTKALKNLAIQLCEDDPREETFAKVAVKKLANLKTTIDTIERRLLTLGEADLDSIIPADMPSQDKVVHFIALLELLKQNVISLRDDDNGDKMLQYGTITTPRYGI